MLSPFVELLGLPVKGLVYTLESDDDIATLDATFFGYINCWDDRKVLLLATFVKLVHQLPRLAVTLDSPLVHVAQKVRIQKYLLQDFLPDSLRQVVAFGFHFVQPLELI